MISITNEMDLSKNTSLPDFENNRKRVFLKLVSELTNCFETVRINIQSFENISSQVQILCRHSDFLENKNISHLEKHSEKENQLIITAFNLSDFNQTKIYISCYPEFNTAEVKVILESKE